MSSDCIEDTAEDEHSLGLCNDRDPSSFTKHLLTEDGHPYLSSTSSSSYYSNEQASGEGPSGWSWNRAKYRVEGRDLTDVVEALAKVLI